MRTFFRRIAIFMVIPLIFVISMDTWLRSMNSSYKEKIKGIYHSNDSIQVLVLGNSHAAYGVDPAAFDEYTYNLANVSQSFYFDKRLTLKMMPQMPHLKVVLISVDYHTLYFSSQDARDVWSYYGNGIKYKNESYTLNDISPFLFGYKPRQAFAFLAKDLIKRVKNRHRTTVDFDVENGVDLYSTMQKGFLPFIGNSNEFNTFKYQERTNMFNNLVKNSKQKNEVVADLGEFINYLKSKGITPVLFSCPTYSEYNKYLNPQFLTQNHKDIDSLGKQYNIHVLDFSESPLLNQNDFFNVDHMNKVGAFKFSSIINDSIKKWNLIQ